MRFIPIVLLVIVFVSCRDIQPPDVNSVPVNGYELRGIVTSANGVPLPGVEVYLSYNAVLALTTPTDTQNVIIDSVSRILDVTAVTLNDQPLRTIFHGHLDSAGIVPRFEWDGNDQGGNPVPSGKYLIRYSVGATVVKYSPWLVQDHLTVTTDVYGRFVITSDHLPVDEIFDDYYMNKYFTGAYRILPMIDLFFYREGHQSPYPSIELTKNYVTTGVFVL